MNSGGAWGREQGREQAAGQFRAGSELLRNFIQRAREGIEEFEAGRAD